MGDLEGYSDVPADLSWKGTQLGTSQSVRGSNARACQEVFCSNMVSKDVPEDRVFGGITGPSELTTIRILGEGAHPFSQRGESTAFTFAYAGEEFALLEITNLRTSGPPMTNSLGLVITPPAKQAIIDRLALSVDGRLFSWRETEYSFGQNFEWSDPGFTWADNDEIEVKLIETATASFDAASYTKNEGDNFDVTVTLGASFENQLTLPIVVTPNAGATETDYSGIPENLVFMPGDTEKTFTVTLTEDTRDDEGESLTLSFGSESHIRSGGTNETATVNITDNDPPEVDFGESTYAVAEGGTVSVQVTLTSARTSAVTVPITATPQGGATAVDYSGVPSSVTFSAGQTSRFFVFTAAADTVDDDGESVTLTFGTLPGTVQQGTTTESNVYITDANDPAVTVSFGTDTYTVAEGATQSVTVTLSADPERTVVIPITKTEQGGATSADYSGVPASVTFNSGDTSKSFTFTAAQDTEDDDGESVKLAIGTPLPARVSEGTTGETTVNIGDDDDPHVTVQFGAGTYTVAEGGRQSVTVTLSADPERTVVIRLTKTDQGGVSPTDYSGVPSSVTFNSGQTSRTFTFTATQDTEDDDGESVKLEFGPLPARVSEGTNDETTVTIGDDDDPRVTVGFGAYTYEIAEGSTRVFTVALNGDPERTISVPVVVVAANQGGATSADYSGVPTSVTFNAGQTSRAFTFNATDDTVDDDGESVKLDSLVKTRFEEVPAL